MLVTGRQRSGGVGKTGIVGRESGESEVSLQNS